MIVLSLIGLLSVYSASGIYATQRYGDAYYYLQKQTVLWVIGFCAMGAMFLIRPETLKRLTPALTIVSLLLLAFVLMKGVKVSGARRWLVLAGWHFQPVEFVKLVLCFYLAKKFSEFHGSFGGGERVEWARLLPIVLIVGLFAGLILLQPDFGNVFVLLALAITALFIAGFPIKYFVLAFLLLAPALLGVVFTSAYRMQRVLAFLDPWRDPRGSGFQIIQSLLGFSQGGLAGVGLGAGKQKLFYLPEAHTDFIFSVIGEETGWLGVTVLVLLFTLMVARMFRIAVRTGDVYEKMLAFLLLALLAFPVWLNMFVVLGLFPTKGLPLPFISSGGSSMIVSFMAVGILLRLSTKIGEGHRPVEGASSSFEEDNHAG